MDKHSYEHHSADELATDPAFRHWCLDPSAEEEAFWTTFLYQHPEAAERVALARRVVLGVRQHFDQVAADPRERYEAIVKEARSRKRNKRKRRVWLRAAAVAALILAAAFAISYGSGMSVAAEAEQLVYHTDYGERRTVGLPDGSTVELNAGSELRLDDSWEAGGDRLVHLSGEAYFRVAKGNGPTAKFIVRTGELNVEVLGTQFNVNASGDSTQVVLDEGRVRLSRADRDGAQSLTMAPGEMAMLQRNAPSILLERVEDARFYSSWKEGYLTYKDAPLGQVLKDLDRTFGYHVLVRDSQLLDESISGALPSGDLDEVLSVLTDIIPGISFERSQGGLIVDKNKPK